MPTTDGFFQLIRKTPDQQEDKKPPKKKKAKSKEPKKKALPKYPKDSWKHAFLKRIKRMFVSSNVEDFHFTRSENILISFAKKRSVVRASSKRFDRSKIKALLKESDDTSVFVHAMDDTYVRMPAKSYLKLCGVDKIIIDVHFIATPDYRDEVELDCRCYDITHINALADFIVQHRAGIYGIYDMEAKCYGFEHPKTETRIMVLRTDNEVETYKNINRFMEAYGLLEF